MSHVVTVKTVFNNLQAIKNACKRLGWTFNQGKTTYNWFGRWVDDSPAPRHFFDSDEEYQSIVAMTKLQRQQYMNNRLGKCTHSITVPGAEYEIGIIQKAANRFVPIWDWFSSGGLGPVMRQTGDTFNQAYAIERTKIEATAQGHVCHEQKLDNGTVKLHISI